MTDVQTRRPLRRAAMMTFAIAVTALSACTLPRAGPSRGEITDQPAGSDLTIIEIDDRIAEVTRLDESLSFAPSLIDQPVENIEVIRPLDVIAITIWENGVNPLFGGGGVEGFGGPRPLADRRVDLSGHVFIPQVGRVRAAGRTIEQFRSFLTAELADMTPDPQVEVSLVVADNNTVKVFGEQGAIGEFPIEARTRTLSGLLANTAGGSTLDPEVAQVVLRRGGLVSRVWMQDVYRNPDADIALRGGDVVVIERDARSFRALGALGANRVVEFPGRDISLLTALAQMGGLNPATADPTGVFVLRREAPGVLDRLGQAAASAQSGRVAYVMDLTQPAALFTANNFAVRDEDVIYVTEAPYVQFLKIVGSIAPPVQSVSSTQSLLQNSF